MPMIAARIKAIIFLNIAKKVMILFKKSIKSDCYATTNAATYNAEINSFDQPSCVTSIAIKISN